MAQDQPLVVGLDQLAGAPQDPVQHREGIGILPEQREVFFVDGGVHPAVPPRPAHGDCFAAIVRATQTPLALAWLREWVTPLPSPIT